MGISTWYLTELPRPTQPGHPLWIGVLLGSNSKFSVTAGPAIRIVGRLRTTYSVKGAAY